MKHLNSFNKFHQYSKFNEEIETDDFKTTFENLKEVNLKKTFHTDLIGPTGKTGCWEIKDKDNKIFYFYTPFNSNDKKDWKEVLQIPPQKIKTAYDTAVANVIKDNASLTKLLSGQVVIIKYPNKDNYLAFYSFKVDPLRKHILPNLSKPIANSEIVITYLTKIV